MLPIPGFEIGENGRDRGIAIPRPDGNRFSVQFVIL